MTKHTIWNALRSAGMTPEGAAGLMGNLKAESDLDPRNLQNTYERKLGYTDSAYTAAVDSGNYVNFANDAAGYGLAQWTHPARKAALLRFARGEGVSIGNLDMQLRFLIKELREEYPAVWTSLCMAKTVRAASDIVLLQFERPADTSEQVRKLRARLGEQLLAELSGEDAETPAEDPPTPQEIITGTLNIGGAVYDVTGVRR